ncbi:MAG: TIGR04086 family membrane protein [Lachnospiraceae bacterium]|nr:TIGR04086 family membrane protein [Lachnospiraceae bacterium]
MAKKIMGYALKGLLMAYIITGVMLVIMAFLLYKCNLSEQVVEVSVIVAYVISVFVAGMYMGKKVGNKKYLWGLMMGACYFILLMIVTLITNGRFQSEQGSFLTTMVLCLGGGMLGGMLS